MEIVTMSQIMSAAPYALPFDYTQTPALAPLVFSRAAPVARPTGGRLNCSLLFQPLIIDFGL